MSIRNTCQLEPSKVRLEDEQWSAGLAEAAKVIADKFGVKNVPFPPHLYKLLFYKEGGHFAKHRDTDLPF